jgi:hypothetical protein
VLARKSLVPCSINDCDGYVLARGWCGKHYWRWHRHGSPYYESRKAQPPKCVVSSCKSKPIAHEMCGAHLKRYQRLGDTYEDVAIGASGKLVLIRPPKPDI